MLFSISFCTPTIATMAMGEHLVSATVEIGNRHSQVVATYNNVSRVSACDSVVDMLIWRLSASRS